MTEKCIFKDYGTTSKIMGDAVDSEGILNRSSAFSSSAATPAAAGGNSRKRGRPRVQVGADCATWNARSRTSSLDWAVMMAAAEQKVEAHRLLEVSRAEESVDSPQISG